MPLKDECIVVAGASGNLGSVVAQTLARKGARVVCVDRTDRKFDLDEDRIDPDRVIWIGDCDVSDKRAMANVVAAVMARYGKVTGLVNTVGDAGALEFLVYERKVRDELVARLGHRRAVQPGLQLFVAQGLDHGPVHTGRARQRHVFAHYALGYLERSGDLVVAQPCLQAQAQCVSYSAHGDSLGGHWLQSQKASSQCRFKKSLTPPPIVHDHAETASTIILKRRPPSR